MKRPLANGSLDSASRTSKASVRHGCVNRNPIGKEAIPYRKIKCGRRARHEKLDGGFCVALQRMAKIARALERKRHAPAGDECALTGSRRVRRDMNALVGRRGTAARLISLERAGSTGGPALVGDERSTARRAINARATITVGDNAVPNAQSTLLSEHNSHGGLFLRRFRNAPDAASATTTFLRQRRFCDSGALRNNVVLRDGGAFRNGVFCIQGLCEALYHERVRFLLVLAQICGCER